MGPAGPQGPTGPQGPVGPTGPQGPAGPTATMPAAGFVNAVNLGPTLGTVGTALPFTGTPVNIGTAVTANPTAGTFTLNEPGTYEISYNANVTNTGAAGAQGLQLYSNGAPLAGTLTNTQIAAANNPGQLSATTLVSVSQSNPQTISLQPTAANGTYSNVSLTIRRVDAPVSSDPSSMARYGAWA